MFTEPGCTGSAEMASKPGECTWGQVWQNLWQIIETKIPIKFTPVPLRYVCISRAQCPLCCCVLVSGRQGPLSPLYLGSRCGSIALSFHEVPTGSWTCCRDSGVAPRLLRCFPASPRWWKDEFRRVFPFLPDPRSNVSFWTCSRRALLAGLPPPRPQHNQIRRQRKNNSRR